ncbi:hypothetical protein PSHT_12255 [Puccinia striiformis]|uniref:Secreted protein n=2 Tax=Puccinia striiformis TaxID=27350 RepID=A0A2S4UXU1_9BASI
MRLITGAAVLMAVCRTATAYTYGCTTAQPFGFCGFLENNGANWYCESQLSTPSIVLPSNQLIEIYINYAWVDCQVTQMYEPDGTRPRQYHLCDYPSTDNICGDQAVIDKIEENRDNMNGVPTGWFFDHHAHVVKDV